MKGSRKLWLGLLAGVAAVSLANAPASAQQQQKPNILFIMGDDIGWMQPGIYHRGLMVGETPNIDRIGNEGAIFMTYYAEQSCTAGRNAFFTGMHPLRTGMIPPQLPGSPSYLRPGTPALAWFLRDLGYNTGEFGKNHLGDHTDALPTAHGFQEFWGYLYHLDAMQGVSFPDINKTPTLQTVAPPCKNTPIPGLPEVPGAVDPKTTICLTPPRPVLWCKSSDGTSKNQTCQDQGPLTLERSKTVDEEISAKVIDFLDRNDPEEDQQAVLRLVQPGAHARHDRAAGQVHGHGGRARRQGLGRQRSRHEADGRQHRLRPQEARGHGPARQHHRRLHHRQRRRDLHLPRRRHHAVQGVEDEHLGRRHARPGGHSLAGHIKPGTVKSEIFASLDWLPTFVDIAGGPKGDGLKKQIEAGQYPGIVKTTLDGVDQRDYLEGKTGEVRARHLLLLFQQPPVGGALQELEDVFRDRARNRDGLHLPGSPDPVRSRHGKPQARSIRDGDGR